MLANNQLIEYLCDPGADATIISRATYDRINKPELPVLLHTYKGEPIASCNEKIPVLGTARIQLCTISSTLTIPKVEVLVIPSLTAYDCLMGRDLISRIPEFASQVDCLRNRVETYSEDITRNKDHIATIENIEQEEPTSDVIIFSGAS